MITLAWNTSNTTGTPSAPRYVTTAGTSAASVSDSTIVPHPHRPAWLNSARAVLTRRFITPDPLQTPLQRPAMSGSAGSSRSRSRSTAASPDSRGRASATRVVMDGRWRSAGTNPADSGEKLGASPPVEHAAVARTAAAISTSRRFTGSPSLLVRVQGEHHVEDAHRIANL